MEGHEGVVIDLNRGNIVASLIFACLILSVALVPIFLELMGIPIYFKDGASGKMWFFLMDFVGSAFLAVSAIRMAQLFFLESPGLVIDAQGVTINCTSNPRGFISWRAIASIEVRSSVNPRSGTNRPRAVVHLRGDGIESGTATKIEIVPSWLEIEPDELFARLRAGLAASRARA